MVRIRNHLQEFNSKKQDLYCVLWSLTRAPYEPFESTSLLIKPFFFYQLSLQLFEGGNYTLCLQKPGMSDSMNMMAPLHYCVNQGFWLRTSYRRAFLIRFSSQSICELWSFGFRQIPCPVRALKYYLKRVEGNRGRRKRLFLPLIGRKIYQQLLFSLDIHYN